MGNEHAKKVIIIDEKPELVRTTVLDNGILTRLADKIMEAAKSEIRKGQNCDTVLEELDTLMAVVKSIASNQLNKPQYYQLDLNEVKNASISNKLLDLVKNYVGYEERKLLVDIEHMLKSKLVIINTHPGIKDGPNWQIAMSRWMPMNLPHFL